MFRQAIEMRLFSAALSVLIVIGPVSTHLIGQVSDGYLASASGTKSNLLQLNRWPFEANDGQFQIHSTVPIAQLDRFLPKLNSLPMELNLALTISVAKQPIHVVVLESRDAFEAYVKRLLPNAPSRRALYYRHRGPGLVLTYYSPAWLTDARHECTHALLDASGIRLQQWLDEGLAEYFETATGNPLEHATHRVAVQSQLRYGQIPEIENLEAIDSNSAMSAKDYRDAWSITAFLLNSSVQSKKSFQSYLVDLQNESATGLISHRLKLPNHTWRDDFDGFFRR